MWPTPRSTVLTAYPALEQSERRRVVLAVPARDLFDVLAAQRRREGLAVDHIYDY